MSEKPKIIADLSSDWPEEAGNAELARLGNELFAHRPQLSQIALDRVQVRMREAMGRRERWRAWRRWLMGVFACIVLGGVGMWMVLRGRGGGGTGPVAPQPMVQDSFTVEMAPASARGPAKAPVDLKAYRDLYGDNGGK